jgi:integron integrase
MSTFSVVTTVKGFLFMSYSSPFLQSIADFMSVRRYSKRTINSYLYWIKFFIVFHNKRHPAELHDAEVVQFLTYLATQRTVAVATQKIALNAIVFLYNKFLEQPLGDVSAFRRVRRQAKLPTVLTRAEIKALFRNLKNSSSLAAKLIYGSGLRRMEVVRLRVKDLDFDQLQIRVWYGKGFKHRLVTLAPELVKPLQGQIIQVKSLLADDLQNAQYAGVWMPDALGRKYRSANRQLGWQYLFPSASLSFEPGTRNLRRHHIDESGLNRAVKQAARAAKIEKEVTSHTLRHSYMKYIPVFPPAGQPMAVQI